MYIKEVRLKNFKRHVDFTGTFHPGTNAICGANGSGKTSVVEGIGLALFNARTPGSRTADFVRKGCKRCEIQVMFESNSDGRCYRVIREIFLRGGGKYRVHDEETSHLMAQNTDDCLILLRELMGVEPSLDLPQLFLTILGVPQGTITAAFLQPPGPRKKTFYPLLRVEEYRTAFEKAKGFLGSLDRRLTDLQRETQGKLERLEGLPEKEASVRVLAEEVKQMKTTLATLKEREPELLQGLKEQEQRQKKIQTLREKKRRCQEQIERLKQAFSKAEREFLQAQSAKELWDSSKEKAAQYKAAKADKDKLDQEEKEARTLQKELERCKTNQHRAEETHRTLTTKLEELQSLQERQKELHPLVEQCKACEATLQTVQGEKATYELATKNVAQLEEEEKTLSAQWEKQQERVDFLSQLQPKLVEKEKVKEEGQELKARLDRFQEERNQWEKRVEEAIQEVQRREKQLQASQSERETLVSTWSKKAEAFEDLDQKLRKMQREKDRLEAQLQREEEFQSSVSGNQCPFFQQTCQNLPEGEQLGQFLGNNLQQTRQLLTNNEKHRDALKKEVKESRHARELLNTQGEKLKIQVEEQTRNLKQKQELVKECQDKLARFPEKELHAMEERRSALRQRYKTLHQETNEAEKLGEARARLESLQRDRERLQRNLAKNQEQAKQLAKRVQKLPELQKEYEAIRSIPSEFSFNEKRLKELPRVEKEREKQQRILDEERDKTKGLALALDKFEGLEQRKTQVEDVLAETEAAYRIFLQNERDAQRFDAAQKAMRQVEEEREVTTTQHQNILEELTPLEEGFVPETLQELQKEHEELKQARTKWEALLPGKENEWNKAREEVEALQAIQRELKDVQEQALRIETVSECGQAMRKVFQDAGPRVTRALIGSISQEANRIFRHLMDRGRFHLRWSEEFELFVEEDGNERSFANLSGGEQMSAALAVRLALVRELSNVRVAFFDEPTAHMDEPRRRNLATQLMEIDGFEQLFVISHDDTFEAITDHVIRVELEASG